MYSDILSGMAGPCAGPCVHRLSWSSLSCSDRHAQAKNSAYAAQQDAGAEGVRRNYPRVSTRISPELFYSPVGHKHPKAGFVYLLTKRPRVSRLLDLDPLAHGLCAHKSQKSVVFSRIRIAILPHLHLHPSPRHGAAGGAYAAPAGCDLKTSFT